MLVATYKLGILGGGQLARMSVIAAQRMGVSVVSLDKNENSPAAQVGPAIFGSIHDAADIASVMQVCEFVTFENEFIRADTLEEACRIASFSPSNVFPGIDTLRTVQDKLLQRQAYAGAGVPSPKAVPAEEAASLGFPCVLKARYGGYDGKGTRYVNNQAEYDELRPLWEPGGWLAEELVSFGDEIAVMVVARRDGSCDTFPAVITRQKNYVCDLVYPCSSPEIAKQTEAIAIEAVKAIRGIGLFGVELFLETGGRISINEIAPRPHNTGHYTLDWGGMSQFEAHVLGVLGWFTRVELGTDTCMANILGVEGAKDFSKALETVSKEFPEARFHWYGKKEAIPGRKMGHLNVTGEDDICAKAEGARSAFYESWRNQ
jgi:5-(carboxyamino)imidazole ribonucleotide synthase